MKVISVIYMSRRNFWCMTRGILHIWIFNSRRWIEDNLDWKKTMEFWKTLYIHFIREPKGITYVAFFLKIESHAKMRLPSELTLMHSFSHESMFVAEFSSRIFLYESSIVLYPSFLIHCFCPLAEWNNYLENQNYLSKSIYWFSI